MFLKLLRLHQQQWDVFLKISSKVLRPCISFVHSHFMYFLKQSFPTIQTDLKIKYNLFFIVCYFINWTFKEYTPCFVILLRHLSKTSSFGNAKTLRIYRFTLICHFTSASSISFCFKGNETNINITTFL